MKIAVVYDCLYPNTVGGAERWLRALALDLARDHEVTYITREQGDLELPGVRCVAVSPGGPLYGEDGRRLVGPPLRFGLGVFRHFLRNRGGYDVVHCVSFPYFAVIAVRLALLGRRPRVFVEWLEYWSADYWRDYLGRAGGLVGRAVQRLCLALTPVAVVFSRLNVDRLRAASPSTEVDLLPGLFLGTPKPPRPTAEPPRIVFAGRLIPEKNAIAVPEALALARETRPELLASVVGDGPERERVLARVTELGLEDAVEVPGRLDGDELAERVETAACLLLPSVREGHGMVVVEACAAGVPVVVCRHPDNAAVELVEEGVNGFVAASTDPAHLAAAVGCVLDAGPALRDSTAAWFERNAGHLTASASIARLRELYGSAAPGGR